MKRWILQPIRISMENIDHHSNGFSQTLKKYIIAHILFNSVLEFNAAQEASSRVCPSPTTHLLASKLTPTYICAITYRNGRIKKLDLNRNISTQNLTSRSRNWNHSFKLKNGRSYITKNTITFSNALTIQI